MQIILILFLLGFSSLVAQQSPEVLVTLPNGLQQKALYLGTQGDTVLLGGQVNGQPTTVRIPRNRIQSLLLLPDSTPVDLQTPPPAQTAPVPAEDSLSEIPEKTEHDWLGHLLVLTPETQGMDSALRQSVHGLMLQVLRDRSGIPVLVPEPKDLTGLANTDALVAKMREAGAVGLLGSQWKIRGDSLHAQFRVIWTQGDSTSTRSSSKSSRGKSISLWLLGNEPWSALEKALDIPLFPKSATQGSGSIWVESEPDGALISVNGQLPSCKTPCRVPATPDSTGRTTLWGSWKVVNHLWAGKTTIAAFAGDSTRAFIRLEPSHAVLQIGSHPSGARIFPADMPWNPSMESLGKTPMLLKEFDPGELRYRISLPGYRDTTIRIVPDPTGTTQVYAPLKPITNPQELAAQNAQLKAMARNQWGKSLMGISIAPMLVGATFLWLAQDDYEKARNLKTELQQPAAAAGPHFEAKVEENHDAVKAGDTKIRAGSAMLISGAIFLAVGFSLWF